MPPVRRATRKLREGVKKGLRKPDADKKPKPLPLVERTNALSLEEFKALYIPPSELRFHKKEKRENRVENTRKTQESESGPEPQTQGEQGQFTQPPEPETETSTYELLIYTASTILPTELELCFNLIEATSSAAYKNSSMGWSPTGKRKEMQLPDMKYMILRRRAETITSEDGDENKDEAHLDDGSSNGGFAGFLEFMITYEDGYEVLYCYEIHLTPEAQGQGLGEKLMERFERIGRAVGLEKTMLTVFKANSRAVKFYERVGYEVDDNSPRPRKLRNGTVKEADYVIMSKSLR
ncbi:N-terminal L-serine N(alpha)-acetyltransferase NAT4 [Aspergillus undulatus]|uniref:N-terminal L-serine N(alpha)-acetyltransferase NAT4 n=1 Tax=Aspergillus undulatus TaxID=1810928 RepID=UPI003CCD0B36